MLPQHLLIAVLDYLMLTNGVNDVQRWGNRMRRSVVGWAVMPQHLLAVLDYLTLTLAWKAQSMPSLVCVYVCQIASSPISGFCVAGEMEDEEECGGLGGL